MLIKEKIKLDYEGLRKHGPINIVAFGDSVTHGAVGEGEIDYESVYHNRLRKKIVEKRGYVPVNVINAGIGGITANASLERIDSQVLCHNPDCIIVCFGLNDVNNSLEEYLGALAEIFERCKSHDRDVIFMTPNMLNTRVAPDTPEKHLKYAGVTAEIQNSGKMDRYMTAAVELAKKSGVKVCDCYSVWKKMSEVQDITLCLANRINHPVRELHELFANMLYDKIFDTEDTGLLAFDSTMYNEVE